MKASESIVSLAAVVASIWSVPAFAGQPQPIALEEWITSADNLPEAGRLALDGTVSVELVVNAAGQVTDCRLVKSSGHDMLDEHTCRLLSSRARFKPATNASGRATSGTFQHSMTWQVVTNANWAGHGLVRAKMSIDPATEQGTECAAETSGEMSEYMKQMACFILINQAKGILDAMTAKPHEPFGAALVIAFSPEDADSLAKEGIEDHWQRVGYTKATVVVSPSGQRVDCRMMETRGAASLIFPVCNAAPAFRYVPGTDTAGRHVSTELRQEVAYYAEG